jgi:hypothetical protein
MSKSDPTFTPAAAESLEQRLAALEAKMAALAAPAPPSAPTPSTSPIEPVSVKGDYASAAGSETRLPVSGYMDFHLNKDRRAPFRPDFHRFVLLFGHSFSDRIKFWSEFELEHAFVEGGEESGEVALEQAYLDFLIRPWFNVRAGMLLSPVGIINERHEPPAFNGVERPFVETTIIPSTWRELGAGITGDIGRGLRYRAYITSSLNAVRFDAEEGIAGGRTAGFDASMRNPAKVARLEYAGIRRLTLGTSFYSGHAGYELDDLNPRVTISEFDGRWSWRGFDLRGLFAHTWISRTAELNRALQRQIGFNPNIARQLRGAYLEPAIRVLPRRLKADLALFARYEKYNTQHKMAAGFLPRQQFNRSSWVTGVTFKPNADVAIKFDYNFNRNASKVVKAIDGVNLGLGWWF